MLKAIVIATAIGLAAPTYAQVRVITGDVEHVYGPGGEILDSPQLKDLAAPSYGQVRVITGDVEHVYGPEGEILDSPELKAKNQRAKRQIRSEEKPAAAVGPPAAPPTADATATSNPYNYGPGYLIGPGPYAYYRPLPLGAATGKQVFALPNIGGFQFRSVWPIAPPGRSIGTGPR
jgi:hypothetical protein